MRSWWSTRWRGSRSRGAPPAEPAHRWWVPSIRVLMLGLTFAIVLPLMSFSAYLVMEAAQRAQSLMESELRERARLTAASIDQMLVVVRSRLFAMAASPSLASGDFDAFHDRIADLVRPRSLIVVLTDAAGHTMLSTAVPFGTPLPDFPLQAGFRRVIDSGVPTISGFVPDPITHRPALYMSVLVPTTEHGPCVLSIDVSGVLQDLLEQDRLQDGWAAAVVDREGYVIAHSQDAKRFVGRLGQLDAVARVQSANEGGFTYRSVDGELRDVAFTHVALSGWAVVMGIPDATLMAPVRISTLQLACGGLATLAVALILAGVVGRQVSRPLRELAERGERVGRGERVPLTRTGLRETDSLAQVLHTAAERLVQHAGERQMLLERTVQAQQDERRRIARELHDGLSQYLTALRIGLTGLERRCELDGDAPRRLSALKQLTDQLGQALGRMAWELRPTALDDLGLEKAIAQYLEEWAERYEVRIDQDIHIGPARLPPVVETTLFRVVQEGLTNVVKHAGAEHVAVILHADAAEVRLILEDNGRGMTPPDVAAPGRQLGIVGMRERVVLVGGSIDIESLPNQGTTIYVRIPLAAAAPAVSSA